MSNEISVFGNTEVTDNQALLDALAGTENEGSVGGDTSFMSFSGKKGIYSIGRDKRAPGEGEHFLVNANGFELGYMCWKGGKPVAKRMANVRHPRIEEPDFNEFGPFNEQRGEGWSRARAITIKSLDNDEQCLFTTSSKTGVSAMADLHKELVERLRNGDDPWPVITFSSKEIDINGFSVPIPIITVQEWLSGEQVTALAEGKNLEEVADNDAPAPEPRRRLK